MVWVGKRSHGQKSTSSRGAAAVEYGIVLTLLVGVTAPMTLGLRNGADESLGDSADKIGESRFSDIEIDGYQPSSPSANFDTYTLLPGDDLSEGGFLSSDTQFAGGYESGPHVLGDGETLTVTSDAAGTGTTITGPVSVCAVLITFAPTTGSQTQTVAVDFPGEVLGWISTTDALNASDAQYGVPNATYGTSNVNRGYESDTDSIVANSATSVTFTAVTDVGAGDQARIFTECAAP